MNCVIHLNQWLDGGGEGWIDSLEFKGENGSQWVNGLAIGGMFM